MFKANEKVVFNGSEAKFLEMSRKGDGTTHCWIWVYDERLKRQVSVEEICIRPDENGVYLDGDYTWKIGKDVVVGDLLDMSSRTDEVQTIFQHPSFENARVAKFKLKGGMTIFDDERVHLG